MNIEFLIIIGLISTIGLFAISPAYASFTDSILVQVDGDFRKVYYNEKNVDSVLFDSDSSSVIFETGSDAILEIKSPKVYKVGPGPFILKNGVEIAPEYTSDDCFYYVNIETKTPETIELVFAFWPEYPETIEGCETFVLSPLQQFRSDIPIHNIQCKEGLMLIEKHDENPACVKPESKQKLLERHWTVSPSYKVVGLDKAYVDEPIKIAVEKLGWNKCNSYDAKIYTVSHDNVWGYSSSGSCITLDPPKLSKSTIDVPRNKKYPIIETTGNYIFEIKFGHAVITEEFYVKNLISKPTQNTISVFCGPSIEQIRAESSIDILTPKNLPVGYSLKSTDDIHPGIVLLNYARGNTCGPDAHTLEDGKIEIVIAFSPDAPLESDGETFLEQYKTQYRENNIGFQTSVVDSRLYIIGVNGMMQQLVDDDMIHDEKWIEPTRVHVFDEKNSAGYKITAHLPLYEVMSIAKSLSEIE
ncbi:hypothetical protein [Nitrosopumilus sp.]|uniref:hypothetical protein n=1 Tax=Nitrosopumilus sp. TaxID=2024843 RepID=UPI00247E977D|nr:hypothetical protein [Nitrosopumilus sp.]MCV0409635.1 hypothetical protein [Nitrosopumilus sp.]